MKKKETGLSVFLGSSEVTSMEMIGEEEVVSVEVVGLVQEVVDASSLEVVVEVILEEEEELLVVVIVQVINLFALKCVKENYF